MTALELKIAAWVLMTAGYLGELFFPHLLLFQMAGTAAVPLFAYLAAESCRYTRRWPSYLKRLLLLALCSEVPFDLAVSGLFFWPFRQSPVVTLLCGVAGVAFFDRYRDREWRFLPLVGSCFLSSLLMGDYGLYGVLLLFAFYLYGSDPARATSFVGILTLLLRGAPLVAGRPTLETTLPFWALAACPLFFLYDGRRGGGRQFLFYPAYPLLLLLLWGGTVLLPAG